MIWLNNYNNSKLFLIEKFKNENLKNSFKIIFI